MIITAIVSVVVLLIATVFSAVCIMDVRDGRRAVRYCPLVFAALAFICKFLCKIIRLLLSIVSSDIRNLNNFDFYDCLARIDDFRSKYRLRLAWLLGVTASKYINICLFWTPTGYGRYLFLKSSIKWFYNIFSSSSLKLW
jgi:hypothetical protein